MKPVCMTGDQRDNDVLFVFQMPGEQRRRLIQRVGQPGRRIRGRRRVPGDRLMEVQA